MAVEKSIRNIVLDTGGIIKNDPSLSSLLAKADTLTTTPSVISEIKDRTTRTRVETQLLPFLALKVPKSESVRFVREFSRKTGDLAVLSSIDVELLALAYELECELNHGDWRLRKFPGQKRTNGPSPSFLSQRQSPPTERLSGGKATPAEFLHNESEAQEKSEGHAQIGTEPTSDKISQPDDLQCPEESNGPDETSEITSADYSSPGKHPVSNPADTAKENLPSELETEVQVMTVDDESTSESPDSDSEGWITPLNIKRQRDKDSRVFESLAQGSEAKKMQVATLTGRLRDAERPPADEPQPTFTDPPTRPTHQDVHPPLSRLLQHHERNDEAILSSVRQAHSH